MNTLYNVQNYKEGKRNMKRNSLLVIPIVLLMFLAGCVSSEKQDALLKYLNEDLVEIAEIETAMLESYGSVSGNNYTDDADMYDELTMNTIELAKQLNIKAVDVMNSLTDENIMEVHKLYVEFTTKYISAFTLMLAALEEQDHKLIAEANEYIAEGNNLGFDYQRGLQKLADEYDVTIE